MRLGPYEAARWIGAGPAHQLFVDAEDRLLLRPGPTLDAGERESLRGPTLRLIRALEEGGPGLPRLLEHRLEGEPWLLGLADPVGRSSHLLHGPLPAGPVLGLAEALLRVMARLHAEGLYHGALTPGRVVLDDDGAPHVPTVGEAFLAQTGLREPLRPSAPEFAGLFGVPWLVPPEVLLRRPLSPASDVFAVAAMAHAWLTGQPAHRGRRILDVYAALRSGTRSRLQGRAGDVPADLAALLDTAMEPDPAARPSPTTLREALAAHAGDPAALLEHLDAPAHPWSKGLEARRPEDAPGPPGSEAEKARQQAIRQAALRLDMHRERRPDRSARRRVGILTTVVVLLGLVLLTPTMIEQHPTTEEARPPSPEPQAGERAPEPAVSVTVGDREPVKAPRIRRRQPEPEQRLPRADPVEP
ncbi:MAG: hypothetical protein ACQEXJ_04795 [Myxococcota bacterium]